MRSEIESAAQFGPALIGLAGLVVLLAGCTYGRVQDYADQVQARFLGEPATRALTELGAPRSERRVADLRSYVWETGEYGMRGGNCRLLLVADPRGVIVDYTISGTPLGCRRLMNLS
ncbi:MAG TPA: hypothetical protein VLC47_07040 [Burkholderiales bacterium]|nr:hypothetical protein [Burkholderiales bacterium]